MRQVVYVGTADVRELTEDDFGKMGLEHEGISFRKGQPEEVSNALADKLLEHPLVRKQFVEYDEESPLVQQAAADANSGDSGNLMVPVDDETGELQTGLGPAENTQSEGSTSEPAAGGSTASTSSSSTRSGSTAKASRSGSGRAR